MYFGGDDEDYDSEEEFMFGDPSEITEFGENHPEQYTGKQPTSGTDQPQSQSVPPATNQPASHLAYSGIGRGRGRAASVLLTPSTVPKPGGSHLAELQTVAQGTHGNQLTMLGSQYSGGRGKKINTDTSQSFESTKKYEASADDSNKLSSSLQDVDQDLENIKLHNPRVSVEWLKKLGGSHGNSQTSSGNEYRAPRGPVPVDKEFLDRLDKAWDQKDKTTASRIGQMLQDCFNSVRNPYVTALYLVQNIRDYKQGKTGSLSFTVVQEFERWARMHQAKYQKCLDSEIKHQAFHVGTRYHNAFFDSLVKSFQLALQPDNQQFMRYIKEYITKEKFKEAAQCACRLGLQDNFQINDIVLPLLLQDKVNLIESYVCRNHKQQVALMKLLDHLCDEETDMGKIIHEANVSNIKRDKLQPKALAKLAIRLMKLYQIPQEECPNITNKRSLGGLRFLLFKKYIEQSLNTDNWDDLVISTVKDNPWMKEQLVQQLVSYLEMTEAARWAIYYQLPRDTLPSQVIEVLDAGDCDNVVPVGGTEDLGDEDWDSEDSPYHSLHLPWDATKIITTREGFHRCLHAITQPGSIVGIDSEWRPTLGQDLTSRVALLQLAVTDHVFLLDTLVLVPLLQEKDWQCMVDSFWSSNDILKLGYGIDTDLQVLLKSIPLLKKCLMEVKRIVDLVTLHRQLVRVCPEAFKHKSDNGLTEASVSEGASGIDPPKTTKSEEKGLSDLVRQCLGKPLDKSQQMSDWEKRPLRPSQVAYAALDAFCLLEVYDVLKYKVKQLDLKINLEPCISEEFTKKPRSKAQRAQQRVAERPKIDHQLEIQRRQRCHEGPPISPGELHVVCDNMLQGLGKQLRCCGVDVSILENNDDHDKAAEIARREDRTILTSGNPYYMLRSHVAEGKCLSVTPGTAREQVVEVLDAFNVRVHYRDIFSRCQVCNGNRYLHIASSEMKVAWHIKTELLQKGQRFLPRLSDKGECELEKEDGELDHIDLETLTVGRHVMVQVETVPEGILDKVNLFYVCATCGKVFWEGKHFERVCEQFSHVLDTEDRETAKTIYSNAQDLLPMQR